MGVQVLQELLENEAFPNCLVHVDLGKLARSTQKPTVHQRRTGVFPKYNLVVDGECCLDRLYGGFFSDWVCGGQWNRMVQFITSFTEKINDSNIEIVIFFNGSVESQRINEWVVKQKADYAKAIRILKHIDLKGTPPPKAWWFPPVGLHLALRTILRHNAITLVSTMDDHHQEVIAYCRENNFHGLIADDADYVAFDPPALFSAKHIKLTYKGFLISKEYIVSELKKALNVNTEKLCVLAALLGNYKLPENELKDVYERAGIVQADDNMSRIKKLAKYLESIDTSKDVSTICSSLLNSENDNRHEKLKKSIQYYLDGTKSGFLKYRSAEPVIASSGKRRFNKNYVSKIDESDLQEPDVDTTKLASENAEDEEKLLKAYDKCASGQRATADDVPILNGDFNLSSNVNDTLATNDTSSDKVSASSDASKTSDPKKDAKPILPAVAHEVMQTVSERHSKGLMSPLVYQIFSQGEIKLPVLLEDFKEVPNIYAFYKPIRQMIYAIMFNLNHHKFLAQKNKTELNVDIRIKEWSWSKKSNKPEAEFVKAEPLRWGVPTIQRLWFGTTIDDRRRRIRAYLTCMRSDTSLMLNSDYIPQHLLVVATVLRYIMTMPEKRVLRKPELDAFIVTAVSPNLVDQEYTQEIQIPQLTSRGIQLAVLFMQGVQTALLANDACGSPIPWLMSCPWLFFDGKLFQYIYYRAGLVKNLHELCEGRMDIIMKAEQMKQAILDGLNVQFARPPPMYSYQSERLSSSYQRPHNAGFSPAEELPKLGSRPAAIRQPLVLRNSRYSNQSGGGQLEVGGVVVGQWGSNYTPSSSKSALYSGRTYGANSSYLMSNQGGLGGGYGSGGFTYRTKNSYLNRSALINKKVRSVKAAPVTIKKKTAKKSGKDVGQSKNEKTAEGNCIKLKNEDNLNNLDASGSLTENVKPKGDEQIVARHNGSEDVPLTSIST